MVLVKGTDASSSRSISSLSIRSVLRVLALLLCTFNGLKTVVRNEDWMSRESLLR